MRRIIFTIRIAGLKWWQCCWQWPRWGLGLAGSQVLSVMALPFEEVQ